MMKLMNKNVEKCSRKIWTIMDENHFHFITLLLGIIFDFINTLHTIIVVLWMQMENEETEFEEKSFLQL